MQAHQIRSKWFSFIVPQIPRSYFFTLTFKFTTFMFLFYRKSDALKCSWEKLQLEWFVYGTEQEKYRIVFKSKQCIRASACNKLIKIVGGSDLLMEKSYRHKGDASQLNLMHKFGMEYENHFKRYRYEDLKEEMISSHLHLSKNDSIKCVLGRSDGAAFLKSIFEQTCPKSARIDKLAYLATFPSLELHRKLILLEHYNNGTLNKDTKMRMMEANTYLLVDPVTLYVPLLTW